MALTKIENGITVELTQEEEAALLASWAQAIVTGANVSEVKRVQAFHAMALTPSGEATLYDEVIAWISGQPLSVQIDFSNRDTFTLQHPAIQEFKNLKGWTDARLQELFNFASTF
jgi:hypothetical protein